ncbi:hypothetical protein [Actinomadura chokoriensis]|uniref:hypothetical protein n=1 Tax=Actinomadura chokoriensis TaxID=454156 RepID=UPI0031F7F9CC
MRKLTRNVALAAAAAATAIGMTATPALAANWNVTNGGSFTASNVGILIAQDLNTGATVTCDTASASGSTTNGSYATGANIASVSGISFGDTTTPDGNCVAPGSLTAALDAQNLPWHLNADTEDANHVVSGTLTGIKAQLTDSSGCKANITGPGGGTGTIEGNYDNGDGSLWVTGGDLIVHSFVSGTEQNCDPTLIQPGDEIFLDGVFQINGTAPGIHLGH